MRLLDKPFTKAEKDNALRTLDGCICRICVSDNPEEIVKKVGFATDCINMLAQSRIIALKEREQK